MYVLAFIPLIFQLLGGCIQQLNETPRQRELRLIQEGVICHERCKE